MFAIQMRQDFAQQIEDDAAAAAAEAEALAAAAAAEAEALAEQNAIAAEAVAAAAADEAEAVAAQNAMATAERNGIVVFDVDDEDGNAAEEHAVPMDDDGADVGDDNDTEADDDDDDDDNDDGGSGCVGGEGGHLNDDDDDDMSIEPSAATVVASSSASASGAGCGANEASSNGSNGAGSSRGAVAADCHDSVGDYVELLSAIDALLQGAQGVGLDPATREALQVIPSHITQITTRSYSHASSHSHLPDTTISLNKPYNNHVYICLCVTGAVVGFCPVDGAESRGGLSSPWQRVRNARQRD